MHDLSESGCALWSFGPLLLLLAVATAASAAAAELAAVITITPNDGVHLVQWSKLKER